MILEKYYTNLETITTIDNWDLLNQLKQIEKNIDDEFKDLIKIERKVLLFSIDNNNLNYKLSRVDAKGEVKFHPDNDKFTDSEIEYIKKRLKSVENPWIKIRYSHVLWNITRNNQYAKIAIDCYLKLIEFLTNNSDNDDNRYNIFTFVKCILFIGEKTKQQIELIKENIFKLLQSNKFPNYAKFHLLEIATSSPLIKPKELEFTLEYIADWIDISNVLSFFSNQTILKAAIKLSEKVQKSPKVYYKLLAENEDLAINQHPDEKDFIRYTSFGNKAKYYEKAGEFGKYNECLEEYSYLKNKIRLGHFELGLTENEAQILNYYLSCKSEYILEWPIEKIFTYLSGDALLIKEEDLDKMIKNNFQSPFYQFCSTSIFDINSNHKNISRIEIREKEKFRIYTIYFNLYVFPLISKLFAMGIQKGKIGYDSLHSFMQANSWYSQRCPHGLNESDIDENSDWLSLLAPGLYDYFYQIECAIMKQKNSLQNYVLCIDSLTTKFEGAIRDLIRLKGGITTTVKRGELQEQLLEELLQNKIITELFTPEEISLFTYAFTKKGWNIRNNVAHCFYPYSSYSFNKATLVFICILKLGKNKLIYKEK